MMSLRLEKFLRPKTFLANAFFQLSYETKFVNVVENKAKETVNVMLQRPPANCYNLEMLNELLSVVKDLETQKCRGIIFTSSSPTIFCGGIDVKEFFNPDENHMSKLLGSLRNLWKRLYVTPMITIAALTGYCTAGGCVIPLSCDHVIMTNSKGKIGLNETMLGLIVPKWLEACMVEVVGQHHAEFAIKQGILFTGEEALKINLIDETAESPADVMKRAEEQMDKFLVLPEIAFQKTKRRIREPLLKKLLSNEEQDHDEVKQYLQLDSTKKLINQYFQLLKERKI